MFALVNAVKLTYGGDMRAFASAAAAVVMLVGSQSVSIDRSAIVEGPWEFAIGQATERLDVPSSAMPDVRSSVSLPHRIDAPNTALWYSRELVLQAGKAFEVTADDGAQVFVGRERLPNYRRFFSIPDRLAGRQTVIVRVLNNAMQGGLRRVALVDRLPARPTDPVSNQKPPRGFERVDSKVFRSRMASRDEPCGFTAWADSQGGLDTLRRLVAAMRPQPWAFSVAVGDLVAEGADPEAWPAFIDALRPLAAVTPIVPIVGNHDYDGYYNELRAEQYETWFDRRDATWFAWSCGSVRLVALDMNREFPIGIGTESAQSRWLEEEVASPAWKESSWRVLLVHQPPWSKSWTGYDGDESVRQVVERLAAHHGLDIVISGHSHAYEHLIRFVGRRRVDVFITGGAGGTLEDRTAESLSTATERIAVHHHFLRVSATPDSATVEAVDINGAVLDRVALTPR